jgi:6-phosphogluconolactonase/glucosamine-6-phosphate isomerase/deaminase
MEITSAPSTEITHVTTDFLNELFSKLAGTKFLFLTSGGSCLELLEHLDPKNFGSHATIAVLDERYTTNPLQSNFAKLELTPFYKKVIENGSQSIDTKVREHESMQALAERFENELRAWVEKTHGTIIATVGVGTDSHTAGILPYPEDPSFFDATFNSTNWVASYDAGNKNPEPLRVTTTIPFFKLITHPVLFVTGESKRNALAKLLSENGSLAESPCRAWREIPTAHLFTDIQLSNEE